MAFSRSVRTRLFTALEQLVGVSGRNVLLSRAAVVDTEGEARFLTAGVKMAAWYHGNHEPVSALATVGPAVLLQTRAGRFAVLIPGGAADWTAPLARAVAGQDTPPAELWFLDDVPASCEAEIGRRGWQIEDQWRDRMANAAEST